MKKYKFICYTFLICWMLILGKFIFNFPTKYSNQLENNMYYKLYKIQLLEITKINNSIMMRLVDDDKQMITRLKKENEQIIIKIQQIKKSK